MLNKTKYIWKKYSKFEKFDLIINLLKDNPKGLMVTEIAEKLKISYLTSSKYIDILEAKGKIEIRYIGQGRMIYLK